MRLCLLNYSSDEGAAPVADDASKAIEATTYPLDINAGVSPQPHFLNMANNPSPRFYLEPLSEEKHAQGVYEIWTDPANLAGTGMETAPDLEATRTLIRERAYGAKPGIVNFAVMVGPESPLYGLVATSTVHDSHQQQQQHDGASPRKPRGESAPASTTTAPKLIGFTGVLRVAPEEAGWYVAGPCRGLGVATEAVGAMLRAILGNKAGGGGGGGGGRGGGGSVHPAGQPRERAGRGQVGLRAGDGAHDCQGSTLPNGQVTDCDHGVWVVKKPILGKGLSERGNSITWYTGH
ncbi:hypothetical protein PG994_006708 [Apiospora phragmitis]|uniref:N-acetyltransferase domain-containing protein n=1 Tax=Apiospora phragmitis TaxID=2905665 RepID=A0ABR1VG16_9PEZI